MATLVGKNINQTFNGLLKTNSNNSLVNSNLITDGIGTATALTLGKTNNSSTFDNSLVVSNTLLVCNNLTTNNNLCVKGNGTFDDNITITGDTTTNSITAGNFKFTGSGTFNGSLNINNALTVTGTSSLVNTTVTGDLDVTCDLGVTCNLTVGGAISASGDIIAFTSSDNRLKDNLLPISSENYVKSLTGYEFDWNERSKRSGKGKGIIAQDLYKIDKSLVRENSEGYLSVDYIGLIPVLIEEVKRLNKEIEELKK